MRSIITRMDTAKRVWQESMSDKRNWKCQLKTFSDPGMTLEREDDGFVETY